MKINIFIPNYNKENFVLKCLSSCLNQTHKDLKIIFIDNESKDNSLNLVKKFRDENKYDFTIDIAKNIYPRCWEECIYKALEYFDGDFFTIVGSDDWLDPNYIENFCKWLEFKNKEILIAQSALLWMKDGVRVNLVNHAYSNIEELKLKLTLGCYVNTPTVFFNKELVKNGLYKTYPKLYSGAADYDLYCQLVDKNIYIENIGEWIGYYYNINDTQATWQMHGDTINYSNVIRKKWRDKWKI
jgi:glycosyltransferase involved in cell wall biosynthesis